MASSKPRIPPHTEVIYDLADILDEIAAASGSERAYGIAMKAARLAIEAYPQVATKAIGAPLVAKYKGADTQAAAVEAQLATTARIFADDGRPLMRPARDKDGRPL